MKKLTATLAATAALSFLSPAVVAGASPQLGGSDSPTQSTGTDDAKDGEATADSEAAVADEAEGQSSILLGVGRDQSERNLSWFTDTGAEETVQIAPGQHDSLAEDSAGLQTFETSERGESADGTNDYAHATITDLEPDSWYTYRVGSDEGGWSEALQFRNHDQSIEHEFTFIGDAQIGASGDVASDGEGWQDTLDRSDELFPDSHFLLSAGDQVEVGTGDPEEYRTYLAPEQMRTQASAQTLGNHDYNGGAGEPQDLFGQHFNLPNQWEEDPTGGNYWFKQNGVLHLNISTENRDYESHRTFLEETIAEQGEDAAWTVLTFHRSIFSSAVHAHTDGAGIREELAPVLAEIDGIDMVLAGHDHSYTRTHLMDGTEVSNEETTTAPDGHDQLHPQGNELLYITANSSSGSKYYELEPEDTTPWAAVRDQSETPTTAQVQVGECSITTTTVRVDNGEEVDKVELVKDTAAPEITTPGDVTIDAGEDFDPLEGVEVTDSCDGELSVSDVEVSGEVDAEDPGEYQLTYSAEDAAGNAGEATRTVTVVEAPEPDPSDTPSVDPSEDPSEGPSEEPTDEPSGEPSDEPGDGPSDDPGDGGQDDGTDEGSDDGGPGDDLPRTGAAIGGALAAALALIGGGTALALAARRRNG